MKLEEIGEKFAAMTRRGKINKKLVEVGIGREKVHISTYQGIRARGFNLMITKWGIRGEREDLRRGTALPYYE